MSLSATISFGGTTYSLRVDTAVHSFTRFPTQAPLPADESGNPQVFSLDLGMSLEQWSLQGTVNTVSSGAGDPSKTNLATACRTWWAYGDTVSALPILTIDATASTSESYYVHLKNFEARRIAALEDRWEFSMILLVRQAV